MNYYSARLSATPLTCTNLAAWRYQARNAQWSTSLAWSCGRWVLVRTPTYAGGWAAWASWMIRWAVRNAGRVAAVRPTPTCLALSNDPQRLRLRTTHRTFWQGRW
jgi:hypothetical protein